jgi:hypothetical protein
VFLTLVYVVFYGPVLKVVDIYIDENLYGIRKIDAQPENIILHLMHDLPMIEMYVHIY